MKITVTLCVTLALAAPVAAQARRPVSPRNEPVPSISLRPFFLLSGENFTATDTFKAVFGRSVEPLFGGGLDLAFRSGLYVDVTASRFRQTGQRAFIGPDNHAFQLGIPLTATIVPFEVSGGYRVHSRSSVVPYVGAGVGSYRYKEESPAPFSESSENVDVRHAGYLVVGGAEFRVGRWVGLSVDAQYTRVPGILGSGGVSQSLNEKDLGGTAARFKVIVGR
jgi:opacity protein-like surface antigen